MSSSSISNTAITLPNLQKVLGLDTKAVSAITAHVQAEQEHDTYGCSLSHFLDCMLTVCNSSKEDTAYAALEPKTIWLLENTHFLSHSEAIKNARSLSIFLFNHLRTWDNPNRSLIGEREYASTDHVDLIDALARAPYGNGKTLVYPPRSQAENMISRTRETLEDTLAKYDAINPPPAIDAELQSHLQTCRERLRDTNGFNEFPDCSFKIKSRESGQTIDRKELYEVWCKLRNAHFFVQKLLRDHMPSTRETHE